MTSSKPTGRFTRFVNKKEKFYSDGRIKPNAFYPRPIEIEKTHISVFLTENLTECDIWNLGRPIIKPDLIGRANFDACKVYALGLGLCIEITNKSTGHARFGPFPEVNSQQDTQQNREKIKERLNIASEIARICNSKIYNCT